MSDKRVEEYNLDMKKRKIGEKATTGQEQSRRYDEEQQRMLYEERAHRDAEDRWDSFSQKQLNALMQRIFPVIYASLTQEDATPSSVAAELDEAIPRDTRQPTDAIQPIPIAIKNIMTRIDSQTMSIAELRSDLDAILKQYDADTDVVRQSSDIKSLALSTGLRIAKHQLAPLECAIQTLHINMQKYHNISLRPSKLSDSELDIDDLREHANSPAYQFWKRTGELLAVLRDPIQYSKLDKANGFLYATLAEESTDNEAYQSVKHNAEQHQQDINTQFAPEVALTTIGHFTRLADMEAYGELSAEQCRKVLVFVSRNTNAYEDVDSAASGNYRAGDHRSFHRYSTNWLWQLEQPLKRIVAWIIRHTGGIEWWLLSTPIARRRVFLYFIYQCPLMACMQVYNVFEHCIGFRPIWGMGKDVPMIQYWRDLCVDMMIQDCETTWIYEILPRSHGPTGQHYNDHPALSLKSGLRVVTRSRYFQTRYEIGSAITWKDVPISMPQSIPEVLARATVGVSIDQSLVQPRENHPFDRHSPLYSQLSSSLQFLPEAHPDIPQCREASEAMGCQIHAIRKQFNLGMPRRTIGMERGYREKARLRHHCNKSSPSVEDMLLPLLAFPGP
ncbi:hypothetical protein AC578_4696 [Pseudocercospora eumusae]|uniref:Uncharacterized protein n=1 Tax=Pseudocercospora eumusae TaxID=321146 RepID=A0A139H7A9_9PEZI|nr:hypothetical protein AC578_4696 [Pseudocercospora eumusae]